MTGFFNNHVLDASNNILAHGIRCLSRKILANELTDLPKGEPGAAEVLVGHEDEKYGGAISCSLRQLSLAERRVFCRIQNLEQVQ